MNEKETEKQYYELVRYIENECELNLIKYGLYGLDSTVEMMREENNGNIWGEAYEMD